MRVSAVIVAGGKGTRMGAGINKVFLPILGKEVLYYTIAAFENNENTDDIIIVTGEDDIARCRELVKKHGFKKVRDIVKGSNTRRGSAMNGLARCGGDIVMIHDGARALVTDAEINSSIEDCIKYGAAAVGVKCKDTLKSAEDGIISCTIDRENTYLIQTPQTFFLDEIYSLHKRAQEEKLDATDDCMIAEHFGKKIKISAGSYDNIKLTTPIDMIIGEEILKKRGYKNANRTGL